MRIFSVWLTSLLALGMCQEEPVIISESVLPTSVESESSEGTSKVSNILDYKPIKPSYQSSGSNVAQIVPPGEPWPASAAGYANFSQLPSNVLLQTPSVSPGVPSATGSIIHIDLSNPNTDLNTALQQALSSQLAKANTLTSEQKTTEISLTITPPPNAATDFVGTLQNAIKSIVTKAVPLAGISLRMLLTKSSTGAITNIKVQLNITPGTIRIVKPTIPPSPVPEIDLRTSNAGLTTGLQEIILSELTKAGYVAGSSNIQNFNLSLSVLPPDGATKDFVRLYVLKPLQTTLRHLVPHSAITAVAVNTQQSDNKVLRQYVNFSIRVKPPKVPKITESVVNIPEITIGVPGPSTVTILEEIIAKASKVNTAQSKTVSIPFKIVPPAGATQEQIQKVYLNPLKEMLLKVNPNGKLLKIEQKTLPNGDVIFTIYLDIPPTSETNNPSPVVPVVPPKTTPNPISILVVSPSTKAPEVISKQISTTPPTVVPPVVANRNNIVENDEEPQNVVTASPTPTHNVFPSNAIITPVVDLTKPDANIDDLQNVLNNELSIANNPNPNEPKTLAIPVVFKPPVDATPQNIEQKVIQPFEQLLQTLEPTGKVIGSKLQSLPNGNIGSLIYFKIPSVENSKTYKTLTEETRPPKPPSTTPVSITTSTPQTETPKIPQIPTNAVETTPIDISSPATTPAIISSKIESGLQEVLKPNKDNPAANALPETVGLPFIVPNSLANQLPDVAGNIAALLKKLEPTAQILPTLVPRVLPNGQIVFVVYFKVPSVESTNTFKVVEQNEPIVTDQDINLDDPQKTVDGEVGKALVRAIGEKIDIPEVRDKSEIINLNCFLPPNSSPTDTQKYINDITRALNELEPTGKIISSYLNENSEGPEAVIKFIVPSIAKSQTAQVVKNAILVPTIDLNQENQNLAAVVKNEILKGLKTLNPSTAPESQLFNLNFRLNPYNEKGSINAVLGALKTVDPQGQTVSFKIRTAPDGLVYLDVVYLITKLKDSILYQTIFIPQKPKVVYQAITSIDTRNPMINLLEKVVGLVGTAVKYVKGVKPEQIIDLPLNFRFTNSQGMSDAQVSLVISRLLPSIRNYVNQVLPDGKIISVTTESQPNSDDVILKIIDRTPYEPDNVVVIQNVPRPSW